MIESHVFLERLGSGVVCYQPHPLPEATEIFGRYPDWFGTFLLGALCEIAS